jgi:hypothetical protein
MNNYLSLTLFFHDYNIAHLLKLFDGLFWKIHVLLQFHLGGL